VPAAQPFLVWRCEISKPDKSAQTDKTRKNINVKAVGFYVLDFSRQKIRCSIFN